MPCLVTSYTSFEQSELGALGYASHVAHTFSMLTPRSTYPQKELGFRDANSLTPTCHRMKEGGVTARKYLKRATMPPQPRPCPRSLDHAPAASYLDYALFMALECF